MDFEQEKMLLSSAQGHGENPYWDCTLTQQNSSSESSLGAESFGIESPTSLSPKSEPDIIIAVMGPTGAGKSNFINRVLGREEALVGHSLESCTREMQAVKSLNQQGRSVVLVDSPGFNDTNISDLDILQLIADWLKRTYEEGRMLSGLLYLHRISDNRMSASPIRLLETFKSICGQQAFENVILVTTMWDEVSLDVGQERENQLCDGHWKSMLNLGSTTARFLNTQESAWDVISQFRPEKRRAVLLQEQLVDQQMPLPETDAGRSMLSLLSEIIEFLKKALQRLRKRLRKARKTYKQELKKDINQQEKTLQAADRLLGKYSLPSKPHTRSASGPAGPIVIVRPSTPYSDFTAVSSSSSVCVALPNPPADAINADHTNRQILHASITSLKAIHQLAGAAPVPGLQGVVGVILRIGEMIEKMNSSDDALIALYKNTCSMTSGLAQVAKSGVSSQVSDVIGSFMTDLTEIQRILENLSKKGVTHKLFLGEQDKQAIEACNQRLVYACGTLGVQVGVINTANSSRLEKKLDHVIELLGGRSLLHPKRQFTFP